MYLRWREYANLPISDTGLPLSCKLSEKTTQSIPGLRLQFPKRYSRLLLVFVVTALGFIFFLRTTLLSRRPQYPQVVRTGLPHSGLPPLYEAYVQYENSLPQQDNVAERKYIFMANHLYRVGWGNVLQEMILISLVASESGRGFVWYNYTWDRAGSDYCEFNDNKIPCRVPISTMLGSYILGLNDGNRGSDVTRPISETLYNRICPPEDRVYIDATSVEALRQLHPANAGTSLYDISGKAVLDAWLDRLDQPDTKNARCVEVRKDTEQIFNIWVVGTRQVLDLWDLIANSPMISGWSWSPLVYRAVERSRQVISPKAASFWSSSAASNKGHSLPLLTLHIRRGDYADHCVNMAGWDSTYLGLNSFPELEIRDKFTVPKVIGGNSSSQQPGDTAHVSSQDEKVKYYTKHCYPDVGQVVERVRHVLHDYEAFARDRSSDSQKYGDWESKTRQKSWRRESAGNKMVKRIYIMTNGDTQFLQGLKQALMDDAERSKLRDGESNDWEFEWTWEGISTSRDLELEWEEKRVGQALDMYIAQQSELFIGNGFSSLTANTVVLRMKDGRDPVQTRYW